MFYSVSNTDKYNILADNIVMREREIMSYDINISNYTAMLAALPDGDWPEHLTKYKTSTLDQVPDEFDATVSEYQYRDRLRYLIKTEKAERGKSFRVYEALLAQLPEAEREALITAAIVRSQQQG
jgi:hypothetical protein